jgi:MiaB/RimO family radical SAM methylthiotransferase
MNVNDADIVRSLLLANHLVECTSEQEANVLLTNTCAIREGAETKVWTRLQQLRAHYPKKIVGVLGCMAERLQQDLLKDGLADLVVGPDAYRDVAQLLRGLVADNNDMDDDQRVHVQLSLEETYADITPVRRQNEISAFVSIQRGCSNRCSFCIVPFTRGQERSRPFDSIVQEIQQLHENGVKEVTLLGQNVNSYQDRSDAAIEARPDTIYNLSNQGFKSRIRRAGEGYFFADLLERVSDISPELRVRFTSPHPKDYPTELLTLMSERTNICNHLHMPAQSGSTTMLQRMKRGYTRDAYLQLIEDVHTTIPDVAISSDFITGFCDETEEEHCDTLSLMERVRYDQAFMFAYSMREKTNAHRTMQDNVPEEVKQRRLREIIDLFHKTVQQKNIEQEVGRLRLVLTDGESRRSTPDRRTWSGRTDQNKRIVFAVEDDVACYDYTTVESAITVFSNRGNFPSNAASLFNGAPRVTLQKGDYAVVEVTEAKGHTLRGRLLWRSSIRAFDESNLSGIDLESLKRAAFVRSVLNHDAKDKDTLAYSS